MKTLPDSMTFEQVEKSGLFAKAKEIPPRKRSGIWSEIMLLGALNEMWERIYINGESLKDIGVLGVRNKYKVGSFRLSDLDFLNTLTEPPTLADARHIRLIKRDEQRAYKQRILTEIESDVEFESVTECNEDEWMIKNLTNARDWLNSHGYTCEVKLTKIIL